MKTDELATRLGVARSTLRKWTLGEWAQYLSPNARGGSGRNRSFTDLDGRILAYIVVEKETGTPAETIHTNLKAMQDSEWDGLPDLPDLPPGKEPVSFIPREAAESSAAHLRQEITRWRTRVNELQIELENERERRESDSRQYTERITTLERELGEARGRLDALQQNLKPADYWLKIGAVVLIVAVVGTVVIVLLATAAR